MTINYNTIQRNSFSGAHNKDFVQLHLFRIDGHDLTVTFHVSTFWTNIHQLRDGSAGFPHSILLKPFANLIEEHNGSSLVIFTNDDCADGCDRHQKIFVKKLAVNDSFKGLFEYAEAYHKIGEKQKDNR